MSLQGSLETFALPDVLVLLASTKKDGELRVVGGRTDGKVWVDKGQIVQTTLGGKDVPAVDGVFELLRLTAGTFSFESDQAPPKPGEPVMVDLVMADAQTRLAEWRDIERVVPHLDAVIDMAHEAPGAEVTVSADNWKMLVAVAGGRSVHDLAAKLGSGEFETCKRVKELVDAKLVTVDATVARKGEPEAAPTPKVEVKAEPVAEAAPVVEDKPAERVAETPAHDDDAANRPRRVRSSTSSQGDSTNGANGAPKVKATKSDDKTPAATSAEDAQALVAQLAALAGEEESEVAEKVAAHLAEGGELPEGVDGDEPINRGLLLKFLSSVRN